MDDDNIPYTVYLVFFKKTLQNNVKKRVMQKTNINPKTQKSVEDVTKNHTMKSWNNAEKQTHTRKQHTLKSYKKAWQSLVKDSFQNSNLFSNQVQLSHYIAP